MSQSDNPGFTFIHYGNKYDLSYRPEAREHNARKRAANNRSAKQKMIDQRRRITERQRARSDQSRNDDVQATSESDSEQSLSTSDHSFVASDPSCSPNALTSFKRDQFSSYPIEMGPDDYQLEAEWFSLFQEFIYLPSLPETSRIPRPQEVFFSSALLSSGSYESLVQLPAATFRADAYLGIDNFLQQDVFRLQANALKTYRTLVAKFQETKTLTRSEFETIYALTFAFMDGKNAKEKAYNAMQFSNLRMVVQQRQNYESHVPVVEWIATMMPVPGPSFQRDARYHAFMKAKIEIYLKFLEEAQIHAEAHIISPNPTRMAAFRPGTALRKLLTSAYWNNDVLQPHPAFYALCRVRALNYIHLNLIGLAGQNIMEESMFLDTIEHIAEECICYEPHHGIALFLWGLLTIPESHCMRRFAKQEELFNVPSKNLLALRGVSFASEMTAWLVADPSNDAQFELPILDFDAIKESLFSKLPNAL